MSKVLKYSLIAIACMGCAYAGGKYVGASAAHQMTEGHENLEAEIVTLLTRQDAAWNRGDIPAFMQDYWKSEELRFASGGDVKRGYQATLDGYLSRYPDKAAMGHLEFTQLEITTIGLQDALVFGRWTLNRTQDNSPETLGGLFSLHMRKRNGAWKIMSDHTSSH